MLYICNYLSFPTRSTSCSACRRGVQERLAARPASSLNQSVSQSVSASSKLPHSLSRSVPQSVDQCFKVSVYIPAHDVCDMY